MSTLRWLQLPRDELDEFLDDGGTGVLSLSTPAGRPPYAIPVSYGYDVASGHFHFRLAFPAGGGGKLDHLDGPVAFVTHRKTADGWHSVVATGELEDLTDRPNESAAVQERWSVDVPMIDVFEDPPEDVTFREFRLVPDDLSGRRSVDAS